MSAQQRLIAILPASNNFDIETACKPLIYSVELKVEFIILNRLLVFIRQTPALAFRVVATDSASHPQPVES
ncbi:hypothetical protein B0J13DRAFT_272240 [Dactylonectria estremocensis]|uniref:DUF7703 domain-containing protein n=1 Tax=Dactylonectria estremocensis TaxID=1079267 RepID=A0A9P9D2Y8_9HYPO|nr:hypothetical protein B0J13DRAFT_272240 [Dactylonectria estremocensis]